MSTATETAAQLRKTLLHQLAQVRARVETHRARHQAATEQRDRLVLAALAAGATQAEIERAAGLDKGQLSRWLKQRRTAQEA